MQEQLRLLQCDLHRAKKKYSEFEMDEAVLFPFDDFRHC